MKTLATAAVLALLAAGPAWAQSAAETSPSPAEPSGPMESLSEPAAEPEFTWRLQDRLRTEGYLDSEPDGNFDDRTRQALSDWQRDQGREPTGQLDSDTIAGLGLDQPPAGDTQQAETPDDMPIPSEEMGPGTAPEDVPPRAPGAE